jgi:hypothetical protein
MTAPPLLTSPRLGPIPGGGRLELAPAGAAVWPVSRRPKSSGWRALINWRRSRFDVEPARRAANSGAACSTGPAGDVGEARLRLWCWPRVGGAAKLANAAGQSRPRHASCEDVAPESVRLPTRRDGDAGIAASWATVPSSMVTHRARSTKRRGVPHADKRRTDFRADALAFYRATPRYESRARRDRSAKGAW